MLARLSAFVIWALVAATAVFWGLRLSVRAPAVPAYAVAVGDATAVRSDLTRLLGASPVNAPVAAVTPEASSRFRLFGIMAPKYSSDPIVPGHGVALIAVDGKMPKAYVVGSRIDGDLVLRSVSLRTVSIAPEQGTQGITLELPLPTAAATGTLPTGSIGGGVVAPPPAGEGQVGQIAPQAAVPAQLPPPPRQMPAPNQNTSQPVPQVLPTRPTQMSPKGRE
jgi:general secretion pathway protein C